MRFVLVINRLGIGDVVLTTPLAEMIKKSCKARVGFVVADKSKDLLVNHPYIDDVFGYSKKTKQEILQKIKACGYKEALIVDGRLSSTLLAVRANCTLLNKGFEFSLGKKHLFARKLLASKAKDDFVSYIKFFDDKFDKNAFKPVIGTVNEERKQSISEWVAEQFNSTKEIVLVAARTAASHKNWSKHHLEKLNAYLNEKGILPVYVGAPGDYDYIESIGGNKINIAGKFSLRELPEIARYAKFAVSMCTGPMHAIATTGLPIIAIYGPSDPERWAPDSAIVVQSKLPCVPCLRWANCLQPAGSTCMDEISFERVKKVIEENKFLE